jgi:phosphatidylinositol 4-kinase A
MRLLQFLGSHFNATRLGSPHTEKAFLRLLNVTLDGLKLATGHPLARELRFQIILFALQVLKHSIALNSSERSILKDRILSAALSWFSFSPRWSFGGNRLQLKAESRLLADVSVALRNTPVNSQKPMPLLKSIQGKETLLQALIESEQTRLAVWLYPLQEPRGQLPTHGTKAQTEVKSPISLYFPKVLCLQFTDCASGSCKNCLD